MTASIEARILKLLTEDSLCLGSVGSATVRQLALEFARDPEPDSDVLAERAACQAVLRKCRDRLLERADRGDPLDLEARRIGAAIETIGKGLHRSVKENQHGA